MNTALVFRLIVLYGLMKVSLFEITVTFHYFSTHGTRQVLNYWIFQIIRCYLY